MSPQYQNHTESDAVLWGGVYKLDEWHTCVLTCPDDDPTVDRNAVRTN